MTSPAPSLIPEASSWIQYLCRHACKMKPQEAIDRVKIALQKPSLSRDELDSFGRTSAKVVALGTRQGLSSLPFQRAIKSLWFFFAHFAKMASHGQRKPFFPPLRKLRCCDRNEKYVNRQQCYDIYTLRAIAILAALNFVEYPIVLPREKVQRIADKHSTLQGLIH